MSFLANLPHNLLTVAVFLTILMVLVAAHEMGHYLFARLFGMGAEEFSIGMGGKPWIYARRRYSIPVRQGEDPRMRGDEVNPLEGGGATVPPVLEKNEDGSEVLRETTLFTIRPYPLGGFVRIKGMMPREDGSETKIPGGFFSKSPFKRWIVLAAGPAFSMLAGVLLLIPVFMIGGKQVPTGRPTVGIVIPNDPAAKAGIQKGDLVVSVDGVPTPVWFDVLKRVRDHGPSPMEIVVERGGKRLTKRVVGRLDTSPSPVLNAAGEDTGERRPQTKLGIAPEMRTIPISFGEAVSEAVQTPYRAGKDLATKLLHPAELKKSVGGPETMVRATSMSVDQGFGSIVTLAALLSISVGIFNLLPFPPLDGGQMWIAVVEMLRGGRRLSMRTQERVMKMGFAMVLLLICSVLLIDVQRWHFPGADDEIVGATGTKR